MAEFNFIGGTYQAPSLTADAQTCYNLYLERDESGAGKSKATLLGTPGLTLIATLPTSPVRAIWAGGSEANDSSRIFVVSGSKLYEIDAAGSIVGGTNRGDVGNDNYPAQIFVNTAESVSGVPQNQLMIVSAGKAYLDQGGAANGANAQQITFSASTYAGTVSATGGSAAITWVSGDEFDQFLVGQTIVLNFVNYTVGVVIDSFHLTLTTSYAVSGFTPSLPYSASVTGANVTARTGAFLDGYFFVNQPYTNLFFFSSINDGTQWSTLDTGAKQASADALVGMLVDHENLWLFGDNTTEVWYDAGTSPPAIPFSRVSGGVLPIGTVSPWNMCSLSNGPAWIGADSRGTVAPGVDMTRFSAFAAALVAFALVFLAPAGPGGFSRAFALESGEASVLEPLTLVTDAKGAHPVDHILQVEVMRDEAGREQGLMNRRYLPADRGMLFDFHTEQPVLMWMKNTYSPLDMIFISRAGMVTHIAENAEPLSEAIISSGGPVYAVLEVNGGFAHKIGLKKGDVVRHSAFNH